MKGALQGLRGAGISRLVGLYDNDGNVSLGEKCAVCFLDVFLIDGGYAGDPTRRAGAYRNLVTGVTGDLKRRGATQLGYEQLLPAN